MILQRETVRMVNASLLKSLVSYIMHVSPQAFSHISCMSRAILEAEVVFVAARDHEQNKALISQLFELGVGV